MQHNIVVVRPVAGATCHDDDGLFLSPVLRYRPELARDSSDGAGLLKRDLFCELCAASQVADYHWPANPSGQQAFRK